MIGHCSDVMDSVLFEEIFDLFDYEVAAIFRDLNLQQAMCCNSHFLDGRS